MASVQTQIDYSDIVLTYFNRIVYKSFFNQVSENTYNDVSNSVLKENNEIFTFQFDQGNNKVKLIESRKDIGQKLLIYMRIMKLKLVIIMEFIFTLLIKNIFI